MDESNLSVTKMWVCGKILASGSQSEPPYVATLLPLGLKASANLQKCGNIFATGPPSINCHSK